ncbi:CRISPR-associated endonuclease Cas3'', partial [candidate division KSB1 bacterium]|nr:CRISPR-associated endonuclease Cas3'' [candidate division KSB1 bacterium]
MSKSINDEELIRLYAEPGHGYTDQELADRFEVGREAIFKRRKKLREEFGDDFFVETERGRYRIDSRTFISNIKVSWEEALILYLATRRLSRNTRLPSRPVQNALGKLATALYKPMTERLVKAAANLPEHPEENRRAEILAILIRGWSEQYKVHIRYHPLRDDKVTNHTICPYLIEPSPWSDSIYIVAKTNVWDGIVPFQLERIEKATFSTEPFTINAQFEEETLFQYAWGIWTSNKTPEVVRLKFTGPEAIRRLQESVWHPEQKISEPDEFGHIIWQAPIAEWQEMLPWIRGWGAACQIIAPESLRRALEREARRLAELYEVAPHNAELFYAHSKKDVDESEWQLLIDHLRETAELAFALGEDAGISELAKTAGMLHDIGKYSKEFQARLRGSNRRVDHATAGAREIMKLFPDQPQKDFAEILSYCIAGHHSGLPDYGSKGDTAEDGTLLARREKKELKSYDAYKTEIDPKLLALPGRRLKPARFRIDEQEKPYTGFSVAFLTRMVFSTLVDADWLETERYMQGEAKPRGQHADIKTLAEQFNLFLQRFDNPQKELNYKRTETLKHCLALADHEPGFFTLTVPTGGGKTYASMAFALNHAIKHGLKRIIYVIPFTGIIEQNAAVFREALGDLGPVNVLEHHSNFDWEGKRTGEDDETNDATEKLKLAAENWDIPIVVTTNVQFFESLFASKKRSARKLHNMAKSVIIFDEVQVLPGIYLKPSLLAIQELVQNYGASAVLCTATQPSLQQFFPTEERTKIQFTELAPDPQDLFNFYRRVQVKNLGSQTDEDLISALQAHRQALCIVNTRKHAKGLFAQLGAGENFHLSTLMCPAHRQETMQKIR